MVSVETNIYIYIYYCMNEEQTIGLCNDRTYSRHIKKGICLNKTLHTLTSVYIVTGIYKYFITINVTIKGNTIVADCKNSYQSGQRLPSVQQWHQVDGLLFCKMYQELLSRKTFVHCFLPPTSDEGLCWPTSCLQLYPI